MNGRHRLIFQTRTNVKDEATFSVDSPTWADIFTLSAEKLSSTSREFFEAQRRNPDITHLFRVRYYHSQPIDPASMRVLYSAQPGVSPYEYEAFDLYPPRPDEKNQYMMIELRLQNLDDAAIVRHP